MANMLNSVDPLHNNYPRKDWQILGKLQLQVGSDLNGTIDQWLMKTLHPLNLPSEFAGEVLKSIQDAAARVLSLDPVEGIFEYLEIVVLAPTELPSKGKMWGFFRVERGSMGAKIEASQYHYLEYYLYLDRKRGEYDHSP